MQFRLARWATLLLVLLAAPSHAELVFEYQGSPLVRSGGLGPNPFGDQVIGSLTLADVTWTSAFTGSVDAGMSASLGTSALGVRPARVEGTVDFINGQIVGWKLVSDWFSIGLYGAIPIESSASGDHIWPITGLSVLGSATASGVGAWHLAQASAEPLIEPSTVPLPAPLPLLACGLSLLAARARRRSRCSGQAA